MQYKKELTQFLNDSPNDSHNFNSIKSEILLTSDQLSSRSEGNPSILLVYRDGCGHCENFKPEYAKLYKYIKAWNQEQKKNEKGNKRDIIYRDFNIFAMDSANSKNTAFLIDQGIRGVPTIFFISASGTTNKYESSREAEKIWKDLQSLKTVKRIYY